MQEGKYPEGSKVLRAKIDMASSNMNMRDPVLYRINFESHHNTKDKWKIYPMYDYALIRLRMPLKGLHTLYVH